MDTDHFAPKKLITIWKFNLITTDLRKIRSGGEGKIELQRYINDIFEWSSTGAKQIAPYISLYKVVFGDSKFVGWRLRVGI